MSLVDEDGGLVAAEDYVGGRGRARPCWCSSGSGSGSGWSETSSATTIGYQMTTRRLSMRSIRRAPRPCLITTLSSRSAPWR
ncbi:hypothetical protein COP2_022895 [Malus domestica]